MTKIQEAAEEFCKDAIYNGMPICPLCGMPLTPEADYEPCDLGYKDDIIQLVNCDHCQISMEILAHDYEIDLLAVYDTSERDDDEEPKVLYTDICKKRYL